MGGGGPIYSIAALAEGLISRGHEVILFTVNGNNADGILDVPVNKPVNVDGVEVWYFHRVNIWKRLLPSVSYMSKSFGYLYSPQMNRELSRRMPKVDLVHTHIPFTYPTLAASRSAYRFNKPHFYHQRGVLDPERLKFRLLKKYLYITLVERKILRNATTLIALTEAEVKNYRAIGVDTPCRIIPNGIDIAQYLSPAERNWTCWNFPPDVNVILFFARLHPIKGADKLLQSFFKIKDLFPKTVLVMAGPDEWGMIEKFQREIVQAGAGNRVLFPGMVTGKAKQELLARADLFCLPSVAEGFSMAILEALASSTAVMISPGCHFPEVETAGIGRMVKAEPEAMAKTMIELLKTPKQLKEMGQKGYTFVAQNYTWDTIVDKHIEMYREGIERHSRVKR
jgi:glycosyltransferase involved in cell wall biosynthesis